MDPASKDWVLDVLGREMAATFELAADGERWEAATACAGWGVRDVVGHLVDTTEEYFRGWEVATSGGTASDPLGLRDMAKLVDEGAREFRKVPQAELVGRLRTDADKMLEIFRSLSDDEWTGFLVPHKYMGPLPAMFYSVFQLVDYAVHTWDIRQGLGEPHVLGGDAADLLVPVIFILWQATADTSTVREPYSIGVRVSGNSGGDTKVDVSPDGVQYAAGDVSGCAATLEFDPATLVLTAYGRINGGTARGDTGRVRDYLRLFFPI